MLKKYLSDLFVIVIGLFVAWPWIVGLIDLASWVAFGHQLSYLPWWEDKGRTIGLILWPLATFTFICWVYELFFD